MRMHFGNVCLCDDRFFNSVPSRQVTFPSRDTHQLHHRKIYMTYKERILISLILSFSVSPFLSLCQVLTLSTPFFFSFLFVCLFLLYSKQQAMQSQCIDMQIHRHLNHISLSHVSRQHCSKHQLRPHAMVRKVLIYFL